MLDSLYENIGGKIKNWAKWMFIFEAIGAVIAGLVLLFTDEDLILYGLLTAICGPIVAYVSSWILYAFGQLVEDNERVRKNIVQDETSAQCHTNHTSKKSTSDGKYGNAIIDDVPDFESMKVYKQNATAENKENAFEDICNKSDIETLQPEGEQCELCGSYVDHLTYCEIKDDFGTRYRSICDECITKNKAKPKK